MANEYTYTGVSIYNPITKKSTSFNGSIEPDIFSSTVLTETYTVTEADVLAALNNNGNFLSQEIQVSCSGDAGTIDIDSSRNILNVYAPNLIAEHYEPFVSLTGDYRVDGNKFPAVGELLNYTWKVKNLSKTTIPSLTLLSSLNGAGNPFSLSPNEERTFSFTHTVTEDDMYSEMVTEAGTINGTSFAETPIEMVKPLVMYVADLNLKASLIYTDTQTGAGKKNCTQGDIVSYTATIKNTGNAPIYNISFQDAASGQMETIAKLNVNETRSFNYSAEMTVTNTVVTIDGTLSAEGKSGSNVLVKTDVIPLKCFVDYTMVGWTYKVRVDASTNLKSSIPFGLYNQDITLDVDWGDGTMQTLSSSDFPSSSNSSAATHQYAAAGEYTIMVDSSNWENTYICSYGSSLSSTGTPTENAYANIGYFRATLIEVLNEFPAGLKGTYYSGTSGYTFTANKIGNPFQSCSKLTTIPRNLFVNVTSFTSFAYCFSGCTSLNEIPSGLFNNCAAATTFRNCFYGCSSVASIPEGLFDSCTVATTFWSCFQNCTSLASIPEGLFALNTSASDMDELFNGCTALGDFTLHIAARNISYCGSFVPKKTGATRTIYVPSGSSTQTKFNSIASSLGLTIIGE